MIIMLLNMVFIKTLNKFSVKHNKFGFFLITSKTLLERYKWNTDLLIKMQTS